MSKNIYHYHLRKEVGNKTYDIDGLINVDEKELFKGMDGYRSLKREIIDSNMSNMEEEFKGYDNWLLASLSKLS